MKSSFIRNVGEITYLKSIKKMAKIKRYRKQLKSTSLRIKFFHKRHNILDNFSYGLEHREFTIFNYHNENTRNFRFSTTINSLSISANRKTNNGKTNNPLSSFNTT